MKIHYSGTPAGVLKGGFLVKHIPEIVIKALPEDLPTSIVADISKVDIGTRYSVKDIGLSDKITFITDPSSIVVTVAPPRNK